jgi:hypothetical protein
MMATTMAMAVVVGGWSWRTIGGHSHRLPCEALCLVVCGGEVEVEVEVKGNRE